MDPALLHVPAVEESLLKLKAPITTKVVCFSRLLKCLRSLYDLIQSLFNCCGCPWQAEINKIWIQRFTTAGNEQNIKPKIGSEQNIKILKSMNCIHSFSNFQSRAFFRISWRRPKTENLRKSEYNSLTLLLFPMELLYWIFIKLKIQNEQNKKLKIWNEQNMKPKLWNEQNMKQRLGMNKI